ncbi:SpaH/EbpB family LPXTG-anchored major pilin [Ruminobacter sp.]|uniref:SpaH/EbpB family LPXTG-anchored major pilin n=1 Tax=Ruminobacter sp. TaxID=2774296 RepID=UPI003867F55D
MKTMKKIFALTLALMLVFSLTLTANAAAMPDTGSVTINGAAAGETYTFYRVYDLESVGNGGVIYITNEKWDNFTVEDYMAITADGHVTVKKGLTEANAQTIAAAVVAANKEAVETKTAEASGTLVVSGLQYGYYVMKSTLGDADKYTVFTLSNSTPLEIDEKNESDLPELDKSVQEDPSSEFGDTNHADIGQTMTFKLTVTAAAGTDTYTITDTMTNMEFLGITGVTANGTATDDYTVNPASGTNTFTVTLGSDLRNSLKDNDVVEITYTAKLTKDAIIDGNGNPNHAVLEYGVEDEDGNKPTKEDTTITKTYQITVNKKDEQGEKLPGATFVLKKGDLFYKYDATNGVTWVADQTQATAKTSDETNGALVFEGIDADTYTLVETQAPAGYVLPTGGKEVPVSANVTTDVTNVLGDELPETGGMGTTVLYVMGGLMVAAAAVLLITKKRMSAM